MDKNRYVRHRIIANKALKGCSGLELAVEVEPQQLAPALSSKRVHLCIHTVSLPLSNWVEDANLGRRVEIGLWKTVNLNGVAIGDRTVREQE